MRKLYILVALVATLGLAGPAFAGNTCGFGANCEDNDGGNVGSHSNLGSMSANGPQSTVLGQSSDDNIINNNHAGGGDATAGALAGAGVFGSGNSSSTAFGGAGGQGGDATQGQQQGLVGIQGQLGILDNEVTNELSNHQGQGQGQIGINEQGQDQGQQQGQVGIVKDGDQKTIVRDDSEVNVDASDNSVHTIDNDFPVNTAAPVFAGNCAQGVSGQTATWGASIASGNSVCDYIAVSGAYIAGGDRDEAFRVLKKAEKAADWRFFFSRVRMVVTVGLL